MRLGSTTTICLTAVADKCLAPNMVPPGISTIDMRFLNLYSAQYVFFFILCFLSFCSHPVWSESCNPPITEFKVTLNHFSQQVQIYESHLSSLCGSINNSQCQPDPEFNKLRELAKLLKVVIARLEVSQDSHAVFSLIENEMQKLSGMGSFLYARISGDDRFDQDYNSAASEISRENDLDKFLRDETETFKGKIIQERSLI